MNKFKTGSVADRCCCRRIYLDANAHVPESAVSLKVRNCLLLPQTHNCCTTSAPAVVFGNPSSMNLHAEGRNAHTLLEKARSDIALECGAGSLVFTSGATEANRIAVAFGVRDGRRVVTTPIEHASIRHALADHEPLYVPVSMRRWSADIGTVDSKRLAELATEPDVDLVSIILAHNETGVVQPIDALSEAIKTARRDRETPGRPLFHLDATQLLGKSRFSLAQSGADMASWSAHKFGGPTGVGGLLLACDAVSIFGTEKIPPTPAQEFGVRPGTEDVVGCACASEALQDWDTVGWCGGGWARVRSCMDNLANALAREFPNSVVVLPVLSRLCNTLHVSFIGDSGVRIAKALDAAGIAVGTGSACSRSLPSQSLAAMGLGQDYIAGAVRFSAIASGGDGSPTTTDINAVVAALKTCVRGAQNKM
jgi:cysteine desulfurase